MKDILGCNSEHEFHTPDSVLITGECGHKIWVSPEGLAAINEHNLEARCMACLPEGKISTLPSMMKRVAEEIGEEEAKRALDLFNDPKYRVIASLRASLSRANHSRWR